MMDLKYDILKHPNVSYSADGDAPPYVHGVDTRSCASVFITSDKEVLKQAAMLEVEDKDFLLYCEEDLEELLNLDGGNTNEGQ